MSDTRGEQRLAELNRIEETSTIVVKRKKVGSKDLGLSPINDPEVLMLANQAIDDDSSHTLLGQFARRLTWFKDKADQGVALNNEELKVEVDFIEDKFPGKGRETAKDLRKSFVEMILQVKEKDEDAKDKWQKLNDESEAKKIRSDKNNSELVLVFDYFQFFSKKEEGKVIELDWNVVVAYGQAIKSSGKQGEKIGIDELSALVEASTLNREEKQNMLEKLKAREGYEDASPTTKGQQGFKKEWKSQVEREEAFGKLLGLRIPETSIDVQGFLKENLYQAVVTRLESMRSPVSARLVGKDGRKHLGITRSRDLRKIKNEGDRMYASQLGKTILASNTELGRFLDEMHQGEYWRGKAYLDHLYWRVYMGELIDEEEAMKDETMSDIFARLDPNELIDSHFRAYTSADALSKFAKDKNFTKALSILYTLPLFDENNPKRELTREERLGELVKVMGFDKTKDLPQSVTDAVMFAQVFALDAQYLSSSDRRYTVYFLAEHYQKQAAKIGGQMGDLWAGPGGILEVLGHNFKLTESPLLMMGFVSPMNLKSMDYHAMVPDGRDYKPEEYSDQLDKVWQNISFYCLQMRDGSLRRNVPKGETAVNYHVGVGEMGEYCEYDNTREDHRASLYNRLLMVYNEDQSLLTKRGVGKVGWNDDIRINVHRVLSVLAKDSATNTGIHESILGVTIDTNGDEVFYNDELANLLERYGKDPEDQEFVNLADNQKDLLFDLIKMRDLLRDPVALGLVWSLDTEEEEAFTRQEDRKDLMFQTIYNFAGKDAKNAVLDLISIAPFQSVYEMDLTPATIFERVKAFGHRFQSVQQWHTMYKLYAFASTVIEMRMSQMEVPSAESLEETISPLGKVKYGAWGEEIKTPLEIDGRMVEAENYHREIYNFLRGRYNDERLNFSYLEHMSRLRLLMIEKGFYRGWDEALKQQVERYVATESLKWEVVNFQIPIQSRGFIYEYLAGYNYPNETIKSFQIPDTIIERDDQGRIINVSKRQLFIQDVTGLEAGFDRNTDSKGYFFDWIDTNDAGEIFGGPRKAKFVGPANIDLYESQGEKAKILGAVSPNQTIGVFDVRGEWCRIAIKEELDKAGDKQLVSSGWIKVNDLSQLDFSISQSVEGFQVQGETIFEGGRLVWEDKKWRWVKGEWKPIRGKMEFSKNNSKGFEKDGLNHPKESWFIPLKEGGEEKFEEEAKFPFMVFRGEEERKEFYEQRMRTIFRLQFGRTEGVLIGGEAEITLDNKYYLEKNAGMTSLIRGNYVLQTRMRYMERVACARAMYQAYLKSINHSTSKTESFEGELEVLDGFAASGRLWGEDIEIMKNYARALPSEVWGDRNWWPKLLNGVLNTEIQLPGNKKFKVNTLGLVGVVASTLVLPALAITTPFLWGTIPVAILVSHFGSLFLGRNAIGPWVLNKLESKDPTMISPPGFSIHKNKAVRDLLKHYKFRPKQ